MIHNDLFDEEQPYQAYETPKNNNAKNVFIALGALSLVATATTLGVVQPWRNNNNQVSILCNSSDVSKWKIEDGRCKAITCVDKVGVESWNLSNYTCAPICNKNYTLVENICKYTPSPPISPSPPPPVSPSPPPPVSPRPPPPVSPSPPPPVSPSPSPPISPSPPPPISPSPPPPISPSPSPPISPSPPPLDYRKEYHNIISYYPFLSTYTSTIDICKTLCDVYTQCIGFSYHLFNKFECRLNNDTRYLDYSHNYKYITKVNITEEVNTILKNLKFWST